MTTSLIIGVALVIAILCWIIISGKKQKHHLDDLHITSEEHKPKK